MGTEIDLRVGAVMVDWSKNSRGGDHGILFQEGDRTGLRSDQTDYDYCKQHGIDTEPAESALVRSLKTAVPRLELLGFSVERARAEYERCAAEWVEYHEDDPSHPVPLQFSEFVEFLVRHPLNALDDTFIEGLGEESMKQMRARFASDDAVSRIPETEASGDGYSEASYFGSLIRILHPYSVLRVLALVPENLKADVVWHYGPMVDSGWADEEEFAACARREQTFLIATEGSSDIHILKHAFSLLMPEVEDFFRFIDVSERHPFSGTGSLLKFAEGLAKIDVQNQVLFLFDNDAEGCEAFEALQNFRLPPNMRGMVLPELEEFRRFPAFGPQGVTEGEINRRAAAIECYLDLRLAGRPPAQVVWTNYKRERGVYQGSLEHKDSYMRAFLAQTEQTLSSGLYDSTKLQIVLDQIFRECGAIAAQARAQVGNTF